MTPLLPPHRSSVPGEEEPAPRRRTAPTSGLGTGSGMVMVLGCYLLWGVFPLYFHLLADAGSVEIKKRGADIDPEALRKSLKLSGVGQATVIATRVDGRHRAIVCRRLPANL